MNAAGMLPLRCSGRFSPPPGGGGAGRHAEYLGRAEEYAGLCDWATEVRADLVTNIVQAAASWGSIAV